MLHKGQSSPESQIRAPIRGHLEVPRLLCILRSPSAAFTWRVTLPTWASRPSHLLCRGRPSSSGYDPEAGVSALGWPLPSVGQWLHVGIPGQEGPGEVQVTTPFRHLMSVPITSQGPVGTHPPHGRPDILCQTPQATQVPLETTKLEGRGLGPTSRALRGLGGCRQLLLLPEAGARHKEQVTQEQLHGLGVVGRAGQGRGQGLWLWERRLGARGARGRLRAALPRHCTCLTHAMQQQCTAGPPALQAPMPPPACAAASKEGPATCSPHPPPGGGNTEARGSSHSPLDPSLCQKARPAGHPSCAVG